MPSPSSSPPPTLNKALKVLRKDRDLGRDLRDSYVNFVKKCMTGLQGRECDSMYGQAWQKHQAAAKFCRETMALVDSWAVVYGPLNDGEKAEFAEIERDLKASETVLNAFPGRAFWLY